MNVMPSVPFAELVGVAQLADVRCAACSLIAATTSVEVPVHPSTSVSGLPHATSVNPATATTSTTARAFAAVREKHASR